MKRKKLSKLSILSLTVVLTIICPVMAGCTAIAANQPLWENKTGSDDNLISNANAAENITDGETGTTANTDSVSGDTADITDIVIKSKDSDSSWDFSTSEIIALNGTTAKISGDGASVSGNIITITKAGTYILSGTLTKGQILIDAPKTDDVRLVLNGVDITADKNAAIYAASADKLIITLADGTTNTVADASSYIYADTEKEEPDAAIFSKCDLTINGAGTLIVNGKFKNGIGTKDDLIIISGNFVINAPGDAIKGKDSVTVAGGQFDITAGDDGIQSNEDTDQTKGFIDLRGGIYNITAAHDGIQAETNLKISGGVFQIKTGGGSANAPVREEDFRGGGGWDQGRGFSPQQQQPQQSMESENAESMKALKAGKSIYISGGDFTIDCEDDAVHSNDTVTVTAGSFNIQTGDDGFHADNALEISGGDIIIPVCYEGLEGMSVTVTGGDIKITAKDDAVNAAGGAGGETEMRGGGPMGRDIFAPGGSGSFEDSDIFIRITGGTLDLYAPYDGLDANGNIFIEGGIIKINASSMGMDGAIDMDGSLIVSGGELITAGSVMNASQNSTQPVLLISYTGQHDPGSVICIKDADGNIVLEDTSKIDFYMSGFTSSLFEIGGTYSLYINGEKLSDIILTDMITSISDGGGVYNGGRGIGRGDWGTPPRGRR